MGLVYEAIDRETGRRVALKTLRAPTPEALLLLKSESRQLQDLTHPALVTPHELFEHDGDWFFSMDLIEGTDFLSYVRPRPSDGSEGASAFDEGRLRATLAQLVVGLNALHADNKVHRDVKPSNVLVEPDGRTRILDFGIAFNLAPGANADEDAEDLVGTVHYMAPEQAGGEVVTPAADWYAVGAMLYEALTGRPPFDGDLREIIEQKWAREPVPPQRLNPEVPDDLNQLCVDSLRTDPASRPDGPDLLERLGVLPTSEMRVIHRGTRFVGRDKEISRMEDGLRSVARGSAVTLLVEGDSGVGKSALVREFIRQAKSKHGARVFHGRCYERESLPFKAVDSVIDELARYLSRLPDADAAAILPEGAAALRTVFPILELVPALAGIATQFDALDPLEQRARMFTLVRTLFANLAAKNVIVVVIDDLQWADTDSLALLEELFRLPDAPPLLLLASIRSAVESAADGVRERLSRLPGDVRWLRLAPLANEDARALARELLGRDAETPQAVDTICAEARGHPLFIEALVRQRGARPGATVARLDDALWERISQLSPDARVVVEIVAVAGAPIPQEVVARAAAMDFSRVFAPAGTLRSEHLVRTSGVYRKDTIEPYHDRVRELVFARLAAPACEWWHGRLALALEDLGYVDPERLLVHWLGAGDAVRAAENAVIAADAASRVFAFDHAASLYRLAIEQRVFSGETLRVLHGKLGDALATSRASASMAPPSASDGATPGGALILRTRAMEQMVRSGLLHKGLAAIGELVIGIGVRLPSSGRVGLLQLWLWRAFLKLRGLEYRERDPSEIPTRTLERLELSWAIGAALEAIDSIRASVFKSRYVALALSVGAKDHVARALAIETVHVAAGGQRSWAKTSRLVARARDLAARIGGPAAAAFALFTEGFAQHLSGRHLLAVTSLREALSLARDDRSGFNWEVGIAERYLLTSLVWTGRLRELCDEQPRYLRDATDRGDLYTASALRSGYRSFGHLVNDDPGLALSEIERARREWRRDGYSNEHLDILIGTVNARLYSGEARRAMSLISEEWQTIIRARLHRAELSRIWLRWDRGRCALAALREDSRDATRLWASAEGDARALATEKPAWAGALSGLLRAGVANARDGDGERARRLLEGAIAVLEREGMELHANAARRCLGVLVGGSAGHAMSLAADAWMTGQRIRDPGRMTAMLVPGLP